MGPNGGSDADLSYLEEPCEEPDAVQIEFWKGVLDKTRVVWALFSGSCHAWR